jgi:hypothetical protein
MEMMMGILMTSSACEFWVVQQKSFSKEALIKTHADTITTGRPEKQRRHAEST